MKYSCFAFAMLFALTATHANAAVLITIEESGNDVIATLSGAIDSWTGSTFSRVGVMGAYNSLRSDGVDPMFFATSESQGSSVNVDYYIASTAPGSFGTSQSFLIANSSTANTTFLVEGRVGENVTIAQSYVTGTPITGVLTWQSQSFQTMGLTEGSYVWSWGDPLTPGNGDSITLTVVPEPASLGSAAVAALAVGGFLRRRRRGHA